MHADQHHDPSDPRVLPATVYLIVGLPGAGKTTHAKELEVRAPALRLTPDEWQTALFDGQNPPDKRDLVEGRLVQLGMRAAQLGTNVIFDFGFWGKDERSALRWIADTLGARSTVVYLPIEHHEQRRRVVHRQATAPDQTFPSATMSSSSGGPSSRHRTPRNYEVVRFHPSHQGTRHGHSGPPSAGRPCPTNTPQPALPHRTMIC